VNALQLISSNPAQSITGSMDKRLGIVAIKLACWAPTLTEALLAPPPAIELSNLIEWQPRTFARNKAGDVGGYEVEVTLEGHSDPDNANEEYFEIEGSSAEYPIEQHWNFDVLLEVYGGGKKPDPQSGKMVWPRTLTVDGQTGRNRMFGVESWDNPQLIWTRNFVRPFLPAISSRISARSSARRPAIRASCRIRRHRWQSRMALRAHRGRQRGNIWQLADSFQLSNPDGIVPEIVSAAMMHRGNLIAGIAAR
jgi:hypothetical protein